MSRAGATIFGESQRILLDSNRHLSRTSDAMKVSRAPVLLALTSLATTLARAEPDETARSRIRREPVASSNVASVGYSRHFRALEIEFTRGAVYRFLEVPPGVYRGLIASQSKGHFIAENIRGKYRFMRVRPKRSSRASRLPEDS
ncbi:MAG TPA: KTSC domain-containing protein [Chthoniobacterales bacterium]|jgi:hypothetical protein|nr:KTSC domain-containing protein [Chthoniobacterales bacterium]